MTIVLYAVLVITALLIGAGMWQVHVFLRPWPAFRRAIYFFFAGYMVTTVLLLSVYMAFINRWW